MDVTFAQMISAYSEIGILALCALMFILLAVYIIKNHGEQNKRESDRVDTKDEVILEGYRELLKTTQEQNNKLIETIQDANKEMLSKMADKIVHHTITPEESAQQSDIDNQLKDSIIRIRKETKALRTSIVKYHNGGRGINGQPFLKMSMTHEDLVAGVTPLISDFREQFRNLLGSFITTIDKNEKCFIASKEELKEKDASMYEFMSLRNIHTIYGISIKDTAGYPIGFMCLEFKDSNVNIDKIDNLIKEDLDEIVLLMNKKILFTNI